MNTISLLPAVSAYCEERIRELEDSEIVAVDSRTDELRRIVILCEGLERTSFILNEMVAPKGKRSEMKQSADPKFAVPPFAKPGEEN